MAPNEQEIRQISADWDRYSLYVLETLKEFKRTHEQINIQLDKIQQDLPLLKFKTGLLYAGISILFSAVVSGLISYLLSHR